MPIKLEYERRKASGLCVNCGKPAVNGKICCQACIQRSHEQNNRWRLDHPDYGKKWRTANPDYDKQRYAANIEQNRERVKEWARNNPERVRVSRLMRTYGITQADYEAMFERQGGKCAICYKMQKEGTLLYVDHDHKTNKTRSLLCHQCNTMLGMAYDEPKRLLAGAMYLLSFIEQQEVEEVV